MDTIDSFQAAEYLFELQATRYHGFIEYHFRATATSDAAKKLFERAYQNESASIVTFKSFLFQTVDTQRMWDAWVLDSIGSQTGATWFLKDKSDLIQFMKDGFSNISVWNILTA